MQTHDIPIGVTADGRTMALPLKYANRHGLVTGSTGGGKTVTLQLMMEGLSAAGVPCFAADIKGDLSGIAALGDPEGKIARVARSLGRAFTPDRFPVRFWDLFGRRGSPIRTTIHEMGPVLMARMLNLNATQEGMLAICFRHWEDQNDRLMDLNDLRAALQDMLEYREEVAQKYGHLTAAGVNVIQRNLFTLQAQGGEHLFGDPVLDINDFMQTVDGRGVINLLDADHLMEAPKLYATFLLWLLTELFRVLPEAGDLAMPKLAFFFDEAHLLFSDAPKNLLEMIERLVRLVRSKGVGVYFVTQSPRDVPDTVLAQLGNRVQHCLRAYTPKDQRMVSASAKAFRPNKAIDVQAVITQLAIGEALVSFLSDDGTPEPVERVRVIPPSAQVGPILEIERTALLEADPLVGRYARLGTTLLGQQRSRRMFLHRIFTREGIPTDTLPGIDEDPPQWALEPITDPFAVFGEAHSEATRMTLGERLKLGAAALGLAVKAAVGFYIAYQLMVFSVTGLWKNFVG